MELIVSYEQYIYLTIFIVLMKRNDLQTFYKSLALLKMSKI